jgi:hypothetical protein
MDKEKKYDTLHGVVIEKEKLLGIVKDNLEKHNAVYEVACSGFWQTAQEKLDIKRKQFEQSLKNIHKEFDFHFGLAQEQLAQKNQHLSFEYNARAAFVDFDPKLGLNYPENHLDDYKRVIKMLELSVADRIQLSQSEFDSYVLNNWNWRNSFLTTNSLYINAISGCVGSQGPMGFTNTYSNAIATGASIF